MWRFAGWVCPAFLVGFILSPWSAAMARAEVDEPGVDAVTDEPGIRVRIDPTAEVPSFRLEFGVGLSSLLVDPDVNAGMGGGIFLAYGLQGRFGAELSVFLSHNGYAGELGQLGNAFLDAFWAANVSLGPIFQLTPPGSRFLATLDVAAGVYVVAPALQELVWTVGVSGGVTLGMRVTRWFGVGVKLRYHLFNLATVAGPPLRDRVSLVEVGVVDRLEIPGYLAFYF